MNRSLFLDTIITIVIACVCCSIIAIDNPHFWRATNFLPEFYEPLLAKPWLSSFDGTIGYGTTETARNSEGEKVPLLDIYGPYNMQALGISVPGKNLTTPQDIVLTKLALLASNDGFAHISYQGKFKILESNLCATQNLNCGFFVQAHLPVRQLQVTDITMVDLSPVNCDSGPNRESLVWQNFLLLYPSILQKYNLTANAIKKTGVGDLSILGGWTNNYEETEEIDYFDTTFRAGVLFPTGAKKDVHEIFDIANGYNGFYAIPISFAAAAGWYDWLTAGIFVGAMPFLGKNKFLYLKTDCLQTGLLHLASGKCHVQPGIIWESNFYLKADHVLCGFSFLVGYSFANKSPDIITPKDTNLFSPELVNTDPVYHGWKMHTLNLMAEYDFATHQCPWLPHIGGFYNIVVGGKRIFNTNVGGFQAGLSAVCEF